MTTKKKLVEPERLDDSEKSYHDRLLLQVNTIQGAWQLWEGHLRQKYGLGQGDSVESDGTIHRSGEKKMGG